MVKIGRFNGLNIRKGVVIEDNQEVNQGNIISLDPKVIFKKGINTIELNGQSIVTIPMVFIGRITHHIKNYLFELNLTIITDDEKYINNIENIDAFKDIADILCKKMNREDSAFKSILKQQIIALQPYYNDIQDTLEFNIDELNNISSDEKND